MQDELRPTPKSVHAQSNTTPIRINKTTAKSLKSILTKINKMPLGKRVKADQIISTAIELLTDEHLLKIKESTYTSDDHLKIEYKKFCETHEQISRDEFLKKILSSFSSVE